MLLVMAKTRNNPNVHEIVNRLWYTYTHTMEHYLAIERATDALNMDEREIIRVKEVKY